MLGRHVYRVAPASAGEWVVLKEGQARPYGARANREDATAYACDLAAADQPSKVVVENPDGTLADEKEFGIDRGQGLAE